MTTISMILGIISLALCWIPIAGLIVSIICVAGTAILKRTREYDSNKQANKALALVLAIMGLLVALFVTGFKLTRSAIIEKVNEGGINEVKAGLAAANLLQAQQQAAYAWNEARMRGLKNENMEQYIYNSLENRGIDTTDFIIEIQPTGVTVKIK